MWQISQSRTYTPRRVEKGRIAGLERAPRLVFACECGDHAFAALTLWGVTLVSVEDTELLASRAWHLVVEANGLAYAFGKELGRNISLHRQIAGTPHGQDTDHVNSNGLDNRRQNLRCVSRSANNRIRRISRTKSGYRGVIFHSLSGLWRGYAHVAGKQISAGYFTSAKDAALARDNLCISLGLKTARLNFPQETIK